MPTHEELPTFWRDWDRLTPAQQRQFKAKMRQLVQDIKAEHGVRASFGIKHFEGEEGVWEFAWSSDGRALFRYGTSPLTGEVHIIWLRVGTHDIYKR